MHAAHRFLDIQIISNKLGVAPVAHRATPSYSEYINQYPPLDIGNSFSLVVKIRDSEPKGLRFYPAAKKLLQTCRARLLKTKIAIWEIKVEFFRLPSWRNI
ncbi:hypothetical protein AVEN_91530-1 [Araneus ventricosus]|uniref:Uncharacterized protein n=1 Tax=Araneus ventricosus TaxID=182803 RepID=A0A4Y2BLT5_ARAVE|nr:hypothetical protein AVEN_91530-1 [Araneus ventricosus]